MALEFIKGQGIEFIRSDESDFNTRNYNCKGDPRRFCQVVHADYLTQFQLKLIRANETNLITNPDFNLNIDSWTPQVPSGTWSWNAGSGTGAAQGVAIGQQTVTLYQDFAVEAGKSYEIIITISNINNGLYFYVGADSTTTDPVGTFTGYGSADTPIENTTGQPFTTPGIYTVYYTAGYTGTIDFFLRLVNPLGGITERYVYVDRVDMFEALTPTVSITDCDGNEIVEEVDTYEIVGDTMMVSVDWTGFAAGCYRICVYPEDDPNENILAAGLCLTDETGEPITDEYGNCIEIIP